MIAAGASGSFVMLLVSRLVLGVVTATTGPTLASLIGDFFASGERGKIYGFILTGDLLGSVIGLFVSGNAAAISWRLGVLGPGHPERGPGLGGRAVHARAGSRRLQPPHAKRP